MITNDQNLNNKALKIHQDYMDRNENHYIDNKMIKKAFKS